MKHIKAMLNYSIIEVDPVEDLGKTNSGILLGFQDGQSQLLRQTFSMTGKIVSGKLLDKDTHVAFARWGAKEIPGTAMISINDKDILAVIEEKKKVVL